LAEELKNHETARGYLEERYTQYRTQLSQYELHEGTESYTQMQTQITQQRTNIAQEEQVLLTKKQSIEQQAADIQTQIDTVNARIVSVSKDNPDIQACVDEIQQALAIQDSNKIYAIQKIISKYLGDKQIAQLTQELHTITQKKDALHIDQSIQEINDSLQQLEQKRKLLETNPTSVLGGFLQTIEQKKQAIDISITTLDYENTREKQNLHIAQIIEKVTKIKDFLQKIDWKHVEAQYEQWQSHQTQKESIQTQLDAIDTLIQTQQERQKQLDMLQTQIQQREQDLQTLQIEYNQEQEKLAAYKDNTQIIDSTTLQQWETHAKTIEKSLHTISDLARDHTSNQQKLNALTQEEKILTNLYQIVSKELLLLVLGESLTILTEIINVYLAQIFSLQLHLEIEKTSSDKVELAAYCEDEKGRREVKSLSG